MAKSRATLLEELNASVRSAGQGGLTTAQDLRSFLTSLIDEVLDRTTADTSLLEFVFEAQLTDVMVRTMGARQAGEYRTQQLQNVTTVTYQVNDEAVTLPFSVGIGDALKLTVTRLSPAQGATVSLYN